MIYAIEPILSHPVLGITLGREDPTHFRLLSIDAGQAVHLATISGREFAERVCALLNRHGLVDVALEELEPEGEE